MNRRCIVLLSTFYLLSAFAPKKNLHYSGTASDLQSGAFYYTEEQSLDNIIFDQIGILKERGFLNPGDVVVNTGSTPVESHLPTNIVKITKVD